VASMSSYVAAKTSPKSSANCPNMGSSGGSSSGASFAPSSGV
jgi:hypothetical protein